MEITNYDKKTYRMPIKVALIFSIITIALYEFGAYDYPSINKWQLYAFLLAVNLSMLIGFLYGVQRIPGEVVGAKRFPIEGVLRALFWVALIIAVPKFILYTGMYDLDFGRIIQNVRTFFSSAQDIYEARQELSSATGAWRYINYGVVIAGPFYWAYMMLSMLFFGKLSTFKKIGTVFIWAVYLLQYLCTGTNVGFFDFFISFAVIYVVRQLAFSTEDERKRKKERKISKRTIVIIILIVALLVGVFSIIMQSRIGDQYLKNVRIGNRTAKLDEDSLLWRITPAALKPLLAYLTRYLGQPYNALAMALGFDFDSTLGLGNSWFILDNMGALSDEWWSRTYNIKLDETFGYGYYGNWHTAYLWFANDVSFYGVPILFMLMFSYFGKAWRTFLDKKDISAFLVFMLFVKMVYFISANNQVFMNSDTLFAFVGLVVLRIFARNYRWEQPEYEI